MKSLAVENGSIVMNDQAKARLMAVEGIDFRSAFEVAGGEARRGGPGHDRQGQLRRRAVRARGRGAALDVEGEGDALADPRRRSPAG